MATEKRLIDANALANGIAVYLAENAYLNDTAQDALELVWKWVNDAPTVDAVEVVRCKDCEYATRDGIHLVSLKCEKFSPGPFVHRMQPDDFCSYGERKSE